MSPEERAVAEVMRRASSRARWLAAGEAIALGAAAASVSRPAGLIIAVVWVAWRWHSASRASLSRALERALPSARNLFITADELSADTLAAKPFVRDRVFAEVAARAREVDLRLAVPAAPFIRMALVASAVWLCVAGTAVWRGPLSTMDVVRPATSPSNGAAASPAFLHVTIVVHPPAYTGLPATTLSDPPLVHAVEGSALHLAIDARAASVTVNHDGATRALASAADGHFAARIEVTKTGYVLVAADNGARRLMPIVVSPDALPSVRVAVPGRDLTFAGGNPRIAFDVRATDDYGLRSLALRYTKVSGSGEQFDFQEGDIPLAVRKDNAREWHGTAERALADLHLKDGDMLVYRAVAADTRPGDGSATSDAFFIEVSKLGVTAGDAFTLPEEESRYALSQQMLIVKTDRLNQHRSSMPQTTLTDEALNLAVEQRMIRAEFVFMLGGEVDDEEVEAAQSSELQAGRLQNRGQRDLRTATIAMSQAQKLLTAANTADALIAERAAVAALQRAFARDRYILRALATRSRLDPARRLTGNLTGAANWRRVPPETAVNHHAAQLQDLLRSLAELTGSGFNTPTLAAPEAFRARALVLAEQAVRTDPGSAHLREAAAELQRAADAPRDQDARSNALAAASVAITLEARQDQADAPLLPSSPAPSLGGAFSDALARRPRQ